MHTPNAIEYAELTNDAQSWRPELAAPNNRLEAINITAMERSEPICRICFEHGSAQERLYQPCLCSGTIKHVHATCLAMWQKASLRQTASCELCGAMFRYKIEHSRGVDWATIFGYFCTAMNIVTATILVPFACARSLTFLINLFQTNPAAFQWCLESWLVGWKSILAIGVPIFLIYAIAVPTGAPAARPDAPAMAEATFPHHLNRLASFHFYALTLVYTCVFAMGIMMMAGRFLRMLVPPSVLGWYAQFASTVLPTETVCNMAASIFVTLKPMQLEQMTTCLCDAMLSYCLCKGVCLIWLLAVNFVPCASAVFSGLHTTITRLAQDMTVRRCFQLSPIVAVWYITLVLQDATNIDILLCDCFGFDLSLLRCVFPIFLILPVHLLVQRSVTALAPDMRERWWQICAEYWDDHVPFRTACQRVLAFSAVAVPAYLAMVFVPLRYGHYLCPLASTAVRTVLRADGSSAQVVLPQLQTLFLVVFGPTAAADEIVSLLAILAQIFGVNAWFLALAGILEVREGALWHRAHRGVAVGALWLFLVALCTSWAIHAPYWLGTSLLDASDLGKGELLAVRWSNKFPYAWIGMAIYNKLILRALRSLLDTLLQHRGGALDWAWKWAKVLIVVAASAAAPVCITGVVLWVSIFGKAGVTTIYPPPGVPVLILGILGLKFCYNVMSE
jgi:hypothetical protein